MVIYSLTTCTGVGPDYNVYYCAIRNTAVYAPRKTMIFKLLELRHTNINLFESSTIFYNTSRASAFTTDVHE